MNINFKSNIPDEIYGLNKDQEVAIFRTFQEIMTNIIRHSKATEVNIAIREDDEKIMLIIRDNGVGFTPRNNL